MALGGHFNSKITHKKHENVKSMVHLDSERTLVSSEMKQEGRAPPCSILAGNVYVGQLGFFFALYMSAKEL